MIGLWIALAVVALLVLVILFGSVKVRIVCREKLRVVASVCGIRFTLVSDKEPKKKEPRNLSKCRNPEAVLRRELRRQQKEARRAERKRLKAEKKAAKKAKKKALAAEKRVANPNLKENLEMILALLKKLYTVTRGKLRIRVRRMHITVGAEDAAKTAILYGVILQSASYILNFIEEKFNHIRRKAGEMSIEPDYISGKSHADIDIACSVKLRRLIAIGLGMLLSFNKERTRAYQKAAIREKNSREADSHDVA